jgi:hypothetical protein
MAPSLLKETTSFINSPNLFYNCCFLQAKLRIISWNIVFYRREDFVALNGCCFFVEKEK